MPITQTLPTQTEIQKQYDEAAKAGVSPCSWLPPLWEKLKEDQGKRFFYDTSADQGTFDNQAAAQERIAKASSMDPPDGPESEPNDKKWVSPFADFTHIDDSEFPKEDYNEVTTVLQGKPQTLGRLKRLLGPESPGMKRLGLIFNWSLARTTQLLGDLNTGLENETQYTTARENYFHFLKDLDDHEPARGGRKLDVKKKDSRSGYGRAMKWVCIDPVIFGGKIIGARVVIHWNPHSSSSGVPVMHR